MAYDPIKAHEYYMKNRKLKGRRKRRNKAQAALAKKLRLDRQQALRELRAHFKALREKVANNLQGLNKYQKRDMRSANVGYRKMLAQQLKEQRAQLKLDYQRKIDAT